MGSTGQTRQSLCDLTPLDRNKSQYITPELHRGVLETFGLPTTLDPETFPIDLDSLYPLEPQYVSHLFPADSSSFLDSLTYGDMQTPTADSNTGGDMPTQELPTITENILDVWSDIPTIGDKMNWEPDPPPKSNRIRRNFSSFSKDIVRTRHLKACIRCRMQMLVSLLLSTHQHWCICNLTKLGGKTSCCDF